MDFKKQVRNHQLECEQRDLQALKQKHHSMQRYEQQYESQKKNFLSLLSNENKKNTEMHHMMQTMQNYNTKKGVLADLSFGSILHGKDLNNSIEMKNQHKKMILRNQQEEIREKINQKKEQDLVELKRGLNEMERTDRDFQIRELKLAQHHQKIAERDQKIFQIYNSPEQITYTKFEVNKNAHVGELNDALDR